MIYIDNTNQRISVRGSMVYKPVNDVKKTPNQINRYRMILRGQEI
jgi:hypothetical protein